jgi:predicted TIM-barrel fold metal-dependent hydrolase
MVGAMTTVTKVSVFDADNHLYETQDAMTRHLPDAFKGVIDYVDVRGRTKIVVKGQISEYIPNPTFSVVAKPGAQEDWFRHGNPDGKSRREIYGEPMKAIPAFRSAAPRLELMDELNIDKTLMFPTLASLIEERLRNDPDATHAVIHSLNEWMYDEWQFDYENRIFTTPVITLPIVEKAIEELEWAVERGAKAVLVRPAPVPGLRGPRSFALPEFDPFWRRVVELDVLVALHSSDSGYTRYANEWVGGNTEMLPFKDSAFRMVGSWRPVEDACASLIIHGALSRFPELKIAVVENGSSWVHGLFDTLKGIYKKMPMEFAEEPISVFKRNIRVAPFWEEDLGDLAKLIGTENVLFGSDYPHPEGLAEPAKFVDELKHLPEEDVRKIMGGNLARLMNVEL